MTLAPFSVRVSGRGRMRPTAVREELRPKGLAYLFAAEIAGGALGFAVMLHLARRLGPAGFASLEFALAVAAWLLVLVRGGIEQIVWREAARRPALIRPLTDQLLGMKCALAGLG